LDAGDRRTVPLSDGVSSATLGDSPKGSKIARQIVAVEMESSGIYKATHERKVPFLAIRGISDVPGFDRDPDWTAYACETAAAFAQAFLRTRPIEPIVRP
jgi:nucleoside phosphorylase